MKKRCIIVIILLLCTALCLFCVLHVSHTDTVVGTWMLYEGANVAPDVLLIKENGSGVAYSLSYEGISNETVGITIKQKQLSNEHPFNWSFSQHILQIEYADEGERICRYEVGFEQMLGTTFMSLIAENASGGWIPATIVN